MSQEMNPDPNPVPQDPVEKFLQNVSAIMESIVSNRSLIRGGVSKEILERLENVEKKVELLKQLSAERIVAAGLTPQQLQELLANTKLLSERERKVVEETQQLREKIDERQQEIASHVKQSKKQAKKERVKRKGKFKRVGGHKDWNPL